MRLGQCCPQLIAAINLLKNLAFSPPNKENASDTAYWRDMLEQELLVLERFQKVANTFSLPCDFSIDIFNELAEIKDSRKQEYFEGWESLPKSQWYPILAKAQHHRVPTRLLDFSDDGLLAAYFAASKIWDDQSDSLQPDGKLCVWAFHQNDLDDLHSRPDTYRKSKKCLKLPAISQLGSNLSTQRGILILHEGANNFYDKNGRWPDFFLDGGETGCSSERKKKFFKFTLEQANAKDALRILVKKQICPIAVYPSLDNVSATMNYLHWLTK